MDHYLVQEWGQGMQDRIRVMPYPDLRRTNTGQAGAYVFTDLDRLNETWHGRVCRMWSYLQGKPGVRLLNDPARVLGRYELLSRLHGEGQNDFGVALLSESSLPPFPLFLRHAVEHTGSLSPVLHDQRAFEEARADLLGQGFEPSRLMAVEFCDTSDEDGTFAKYSAFRVGDAIIPRYRTVSERWMVKTRGSLVTEEIARLEYDYIDQNPHRDELDRIFRTANIDYGRVDYGIRGGKLQIWEINVNPMVGRVHQPGAQVTEERRKRSLLRRPANKIFYRRFAEALSALADG